MKKMSKHVCLKITSCSFDHLAFIVCDAGEDDMTWKIRTAKTLRTPPPPLLLSFSAICREDLVSGSHFQFPRFFNRQGKPLFEGHALRVAGLFTASISVFSFQRGVQTHAEISPAERKGGDRRRKKNSWWVYSNVLTKLSRERKYWRPYSADNAKLRIVLPLFVAQIHLIWIFSFGILWSRSISWEAMWKKPNLIMLFRTSF